MGSSYIINQLDLFLGEIRQTGNSEVLLQALDLG